jgi:hypothetical protein
MSQELEREVISLVATDRLYVPSSSFDGKLERSRPKIGKAIAGIEEFQEVYEGDFQGERTYATVTTVNKQKARDMRTGIEEFSQEFPQYGTILNGFIEKQRVKKEQHLQFGMQDGKRLTKEDYVEVLTNMGLGPVTAEKYCDVALDISRTMNRKRGYEDRSVLIG